MLLLESYPYIFETEDKAVILLLSTTTCLSLLGHHLGINHSLSRHGVC